MRKHAGYAFRSMWWRRFHPLVRVGWYVATSGSSRPASQTAIGLGMVGAGFVLRRSHKAKNKPIYTHVVSPGESTRIRVYRGNSSPTEAVIRT